MHRGGTRIIHLQLAIFLQIGESLNVNYWGTGERNSYIDFHAQGTAPQGSTIGTGYDYDARLIREPGVNGKFELTNKGDRSYNC